MNDNKTYLQSEITNTILQGFYKVSNTLCLGFCEKAYRNALLIELKKLGLQCDSEKLISIFYQGIEIDAIRPGILVNEKVLFLLTNHSELIESETRKLYKY